MSSWLGPALLFVGGALTTMVLEAVTGRATGLVLRRWVKARSRRRLRKMSSHDDLIWVTRTDAVYLHQFVPDGWDPDKIRIHFDEDAPRLSDELARADPALLPKPPDQLLAAVAAKAQELDEHPSFWNGETLGILSIRNALRTRDSELPILTVRTYPSAHAATTVMSETWEREFDPALWRERERNFSQLQLQQMRDGLPGMLHAIGLNATLVTSDGFLVLTKRNPRMSSGRNGWHISVNEGMTKYDRHRNVLDPRVGIVRGVDEELGLDISVDNVVIHSAIHDVTRYQFGLLGHIDLAGTDITADRIMAARKLGLGKDKVENTHLEVIDFNPREVKKVLRDENWLAHGWVNLVLSAIHAMRSDQAEFTTLLHSRGGHRPSRSNKEHADG
jgi:hypothetical protein